MSLLVAVPGWSWAGLAVNQKSRGSCSLGWSLPLMVDKELLHSGIMDTFENVMKSVETLLQKNRKSAKCGIQYGVFPRNLKFTLGPVIKKPGMAQILWESKPIRFFGMQVGQ